MRLAIYAGTFDPVTFGHLDVIERSLRVFDQVEITVAINATKSTLFTIDERCALISACTGHLDRVKVSMFER